MRLDRDAYFTPRHTSKEIIINAIKDEPELLKYEWVEPSAGSGSFLYAAEELGIEITGYDIHPLRNDIIKNDFLEDDLDLSGKVVIGNPPYGFRHKLALDFIDRSFEQGAEYVGFLLMSSFATYSNFSRLKSNCEIIAVRKYNVVFEDENSNLEKSCMASKNPSVFVLLKKSDTRLKDLEISNIYSRCLEVEKANFACEGVLLIRSFIHPMKYPTPHVIIKPVANGIAMPSFLLNAFMIQMIPTASHTPPQASNEIRRVINSIVSGTCTLLIGRKAMPLRMQYMPNNTMAVFLRFSFSFITVMFCSP